MIKELSENNYIVVPNFIEKNRAISLSNEFKINTYINEKVD